MFKLLDRFYEKSRIWFAVAWIVAYVLLASEADALSLDLGAQKMVTAPVLLAMSVVLWAWVRHSGLGEHFGLRAPSVSASRMLWYLPIAIIAVKKLFFGIAPDGTAAECLFWVISMCCVGYIEELIFRGFLFRAMDEDGRTSAVVVSSITFGMGHIVNSFNATGQDLMTSLVQVVFAVSVGFVLVLVLLKGGSLWPCVVFHMVNNALVIFENEAAQVALFGSEQMAMLVGPGVSLVLALGYSLYLLRLPDAE
jgi:membrane protease YdiL (CAAX protease family)